MGEDCKVRKEFLQILKCPECGKEGFELKREIKNNLEIRKGRVKCIGCGKVFGIKKGILDFLVNPSKEILSEQKGWKKDHEQNFLQKRGEEFLKQVPYIKGDKEEERWWNEQAKNFEQALDLAKVKKKADVLDIGAGRCWSTREIAKKGAKAVALDVLREKYIGLESSETYLGKNCFFERVLADMNFLPFRDKSFDLVFSTASLHHSTDLGKTLKEISRVLKNKGTLVLANEPVRGVFEEKEVKSKETDLGINEHKYSFFQWIKEAEKAGFRVETFMPKSIEEMMEKQKVFGDKKYKVVAGKIASKIWSNRVGRSLLKKMHVPAQVFFGIGLVMVAKKVKE